MCSRPITADEATMLTKRVAYVTPSRVMVPIAKGETEEVSLVISTGSNMFRVDKDDKRKIIDKNPLEPIAYSENGQREMLLSMGLGLSEDGTIWWVKPKKNFATGLAEADGVMKEIDAATMSEMMSTDWEFSKMMCVELAPPCVGKATHWLVCQPIRSADGLHWNILKRDASGIWKTEENVYFVVPVGYQNVIFDASDSSEYKSREVFFEASAAEFRRVCLAEMDRSINERRAERKRQEELPKLRQLASEYVRHYAEIIQEAPYYLAFLQHNDKTDPKVEFDAVTDRLFFDGEWHELSSQVIFDCCDLLEKLQETVTEFKTRSQKADSIRNLLQDIPSVTVRDFFCKMKRTVASGFLGKSVEVDLLEFEATITVLVRGKEKERMAIDYSMPSASSAFYAQLERLNLLGKDEGDYARNTAKRSLYEFFSGFAKA